MLLLTKHPRHDKRLYSGLVGEVKQFGRSNFLGHDRQQSPDWSECTAWKRGRVLPLGHTSRFRWGFHSPRFGARRRAQLQVVCRARIALQCRILLDPVDRDISQ